MPHHIGIVGVSPEGAALFYRQLSRQASRFLPPNEHPAVTLHNEPLALYIDAIRRQDWHGVGRLLRRSAEILDRCGATMCVTPDDAVQHAIPLAESGSPVPWIAMTDLVAHAVARDARQVVGLIGTKLVTSGSTYQTRLGLKGVRVLPPEPEEADLLDQIIFGELIYGACRPESRQAVLSVIGRFAERGCQAVILGCSEAPLIVTSQSSPLPLYDAADILAEGVVRRAAGVS